MIDPVALTQELIRRPSVTPADEGAMDVVEKTLSGLGFVCRRMRFGEIENLLMHEHSNKLFRDDQEDQLPERYVSRIEPPDN